MTNQSTPQSPPPPVNALLPDDSITQLLVYKESLYALTSLGFILRCDDSAWVWRQVPAPIDFNLARSLQENSDGSQKTE